jgi:hypothetical protein
MQHEAGDEVGYWLGLFFDPENGGEVFLRNQHEAGINAGSLLGIFFDTGDGGDMFLRNQHEAGINAGSLLGIFCNIEDGGDMFLRNQHETAMLVSCLAYFSILKMEATCSSETSMKQQCLFLAWLIYSSNLKV